MISVNLLKKAGLQIQGIEEERLEKPEKSSVVFEEKKTIDQKQFESVKKEIEAKISVEKPPFEPKRKRRNIYIYITVIFSLIIIIVAFIGYRYISRKLSPPESLPTVNENLQAEKPQVVKKFPVQPIKPKSAGIDNLFVTTLPSEYYSSLYNGYGIIYSTGRIIKKINVYLNVRYVKAGYASFSFSGTLKNNNARLQIENALKSDRSITDIGTLLFLEDNGSTEVISICSVNYILDKKPTQFYYCNINQISKLIGYCSTKSNIPVPIIKIASSDEYGYNATILGKADLAGLISFFDKLGSYPVNIKYNSIFIINIDDDNNYEFSIELKILKVRSNA
ncbi:MAG: hypothetical protein H0Z29_04080 [Candidatus Marinimicrobia bacterium]|nr:hypothetical protein [Candidatus Neomarinimicrobiota bacterium]